MKVVLSRCFFAVIFFSLVAGAGTVSAHTPPVPKTDKSLEFVMNKNQWPAAVKFRAALPGGFVDLQQDRLLYMFMDAAEMPKHGSQPPVTGKPAKNYIPAHNYTVTFLNASKQARIQPELPTEGYRNYFIGDDPAHWASEVKAYRQAAYKALYPGIDVKFYEHRKHLKYDFLLAAKADPALIKMQYAGAEKLYLENGNLVIETTVNKVTEQKPYAYQVINGKEVEVPCRFLLQNSTVSFEFPEGYKRNLPLVIDPTLVFSSYSGSWDDNWGFTATYDQAGNLYSGGITLGNPGVSYPTSPGAYQIAKGGGVDIAIIKYNPNTSGSAIRMYATYLGGSGTESPHSLVVNSQDQLLVLGTTSSNDFPRPKGVQTFDSTFNGGVGFTAPLGGSDFLYVAGSDMVISKLNASGTALLATTYLGGSGNDGLLSAVSPLVKNYGDQFRGDILTDSQDNVYIASSTGSANFPKLNGYNRSFAGASDGVICKFTPNLSTLFWSNFIGGVGADAVFSVQVDSGFNVYACGGTTSPDLPQTAGAFKPGPPPGIPIAVAEGFACKINSSGNTLVQTTYIGAPGNGYDQTYFLQLDAFSNVYVLGQSSGNYPVVAAPGAPSVFSVPDSRQFIQKLSSDLRTGIFSTAFGSPRNNPSVNNFNISPSAFLVDNCERIFVCGWGGTINFGGLYVGGNTFGMPVTSNALRTTTDGSDFYLMQLSQDAAKLDYATYMGASSNTSAEHVVGGTSRFDKRGFIYQAVCAGCRGTNAFPTTPNAWSNTNNSANCNNAAFKFDFAVSSAVVGTKQTICANAGPTAITGASPAGGVWSGIGVTPGGTFTPTPALTGTTVTLTYTVTVGTCVSFATKEVSVVAPPQISFTGLVLKDYCLDSSPITLTGSEPKGVFSGAGIINGNQWSPAVAGPGKHIISYSYKDLNGCTAVVTDSVTVPPAITVSAGPDEGVCAGSEPLPLAGATPAGGTWSGPGVTAGTAVFTPDFSLTGPQTLTYTYQKDNCLYTDTKVVSVNPAPEVVPSFEFGDCTLEDSTATGYTPLLVRFKNNSTIGKSYYWDFGDGAFSSEASPEHTYTQAGTYTVTLTTDFGRSCIRTNTILPIKAIETKLPNIITPNNDGKNDTFLPMVTCKPQNLKIYNRWGKLVYEQNDYISEFTGKNLAEGTYYYLLKDTDNRTWKGWVQIVK